MNMLPYEGGGSSECVRAHWYARASSHVEWMIRSPGLTSSGRSSAGYRGPTRRCMVMAPGLHGQRWSRDIREHVLKRRRRNTSVAANVATASVPSKFVDIVKHPRYIVWVGWLLRSAETGIVNVGMLNVEGGGFTNMLRRSVGGLKRGFGCS